MYTEGVTYEPKNDHISMIITHKNAIEEVMNIEACTLKEMLAGLNPDQLKVIIEYSPSPDERNIAKEFLDTPEKATIELFREALRRVDHLELIDIIKSKNTYGKEVAEQELESRP